MRERPDASWQRLCRETLMPLLEALEKEAKGAREREDVENVHRMRVASRRIRSALEVFRDCFPPKSWKSWRKSMRRVTKALGEARDTDVQIEFLQEVRNRCPESALPGVRFVLELKQRRRDELQAPLVTAINELEEGAVLEEMRRALRQMPKSSSQDGESVGWSAFPYRKAHELVRERLHDLFFREECVYRPEAIEDHHALRISAKRLRYTLEIFRPLFKDELKDAIELIKKMQDKLGEMHDCDVWIQSLEEMMSSLKKGHPHISWEKNEENIEPGLRFIKEDRTSLRHASYQEFVQLWDHMIREGTLLKLQRKLEEAAEAEHDLTLEALESFRNKPGMTVAIVGDVHGNHHALEAVLQDAKKRGAEVIISTGDLLGPFGNAEECISMLRAHPCVGVIGNYDVRVLEMLDGKKRGKTQKDETTLLQLSLSGLSNTSKAWIMSLPRSLRLKWGGRNLLVVHGSPDSMTERLEPETEEDRLRELASKAKAEIVISGHSHLPFYRQVGNTRFLNPGAVGRQSDGDPRASYALMRVRPLQVNLRRVQYDVEAAAKEILNEGRPKSLAEILLSGKAEPNHDSKAAVDMEDDRFEKIRMIYKNYLGEDSHTEQVIRLSTALFDSLCDELSLKDKDRFLLRCAAALHDIGWREGRVKHHKTSQRMIMEAEGLPLDEDERRMVASVARYHRKALPKKNHPLICNMSGKERRRLEALAALLRLADGLDSSHGTKVKEISCEVTCDKIIIRCLATPPIDMEDEDAKAKSDLLQRVTGRDVEIIWDVN
ncbi:MAG: CHAD domain-containing protein [Methanomassiliicoccales archaeon]